MNSTTGGNLGNLPDRHEVRATDSGTSTPIHASRGGRKTTRMPHVTVSTAPRAISTGIDASGIPKHIEFQALPRCKSRMHVPWVVAPQTSPGAMLSRRCPRTSKPFLHQLFHATSSRRIIETGPTTLKSLNSPSLVQPRACQKFSSPGPAPHATTSP